MNRFYSGPYTKILVVFVAYLLLQVLFFNSLYSTTTFFHLLLGHSVNIIQDWFEDRSWQIMAFSKLFPALILVWLGRIYFKVDLSFKDFFKRGIGLDFREWMVPLFYLAFTQVLHGGIVERVNDFSPYHLDQVIFYKGLFFYIDAFFLLTLLYFSKVERKHYFFMGLVFAGAVYFANGKVYYNMPYYGIAQFFELLLAVMLGTLSGWNLILPLMYALFVYGPTHYLFHLDPVWGKKLTIFSKSQDYGVTFYSMVIVVTYFYQTSLLGTIVKKLSKRKAWN